jgi:hypothetical protein
VLVIASVAVNAPHHNPQPQPGITNKRSTKKRIIPRDKPEAQLPSIGTREGDPSSMTPGRVDPSLTLRVVKKLEKMRIATAVSPEFATYKPSAIRPPKCLAVARRASRRL